jgi:hypothetical protein
MTAPAEIATTGEIPCPDDMVTTCGICGKPFHPLGRQRGVAPHAQPPLGARHHQPAHTKPAPPPPSTTRPAPGSDSLRMRLLWRAGHRTATLRRLQHLYAGGRHRSTLPLLQYPHSHKRARRLQQRLTHQQTSNPSLGKNPPATNFPLTSWTHGISKRRVRRRPACAASRPWRHLPPAREIVKSCG